MSLNKSILFNFLTRFGTAIFNLLLAVIISRELGTESRGEQALFITSVALIQLFTNWLGGSSLVYLVPRHSSRGLLLISSIWSLITCTVAWAIIAWLGLIPAEFNGALWIAAFLFAMWSNLNNMLLGKERTSDFNLLQVLHPLLTFGLFCIWLYSIEKSIGAFIWAYTLAQGVTLLVALGKSRWILDDEREQSKSKLLRVFMRHGVFIQLANVTQFLNYRLLYYFIEHFFGRHFLGIYSNAISLAESVWMVTRSISTMQFARISNSEDDKANRKLTNNYARISLLISAVLMVILVLLPDTFFSWLFGPEFIGIHKVLVYLAPAILAMSASNIFAHYFSGRGLNGVNFLGSLTKLIFILLAFFLMKDHLDKQTAALSSSIGFLAGLVFHWLMYRFWKGPTNP